MAHGGFTIAIKPAAQAELNAIKPFDRRPVVDAIVQQLTIEPQTQTRNRKRLDGVVPAFEFSPPLWELRVGEYRVFYDVDEATRRVLIRAVRRKGNRTTQETVS